MINVDVPVTAADWVYSQGSTKHYAFDREEVVEEIKQEFPKANNLVNETNDAPWEINLGRDIYILWDKADFFLDTT